MRSARMLGILALAFSSPFSIPLSIPQKSNARIEPRWTWFTECREKRYLGIEALLDGKSIHQSSFPVCPIRDGYKEVGAKEKIVVFRFAGGHIFQGEHRTSTNETVEGNIWQAGSDPGVILLGLSFSNKRQVLLNTIHFAKPDRETRTEIDRDLKVRTFPLSLKKHS
jgi:hypothetical protein